MQMPPLDPDVADIAPSGPVLTGYDLAADLLEKLSSGG
jgi:hypothetical protein